MNSIVTQEEALQKAAQKLDISPSKYRQAMGRFDSMKSYLLECDRNAAGLPDVYLQGSFKLGTEIRPYRDSKDADYDIDIVCRLERQKSTFSPGVVKHLVGNHLKTHGTYGKMLDDESRRCWTLNYAEDDGIGFHMDILPAAREEYFKPINAIAVTNKCNKSGIYNWSSSNPKDFAKWFYGKNRIAFENVKQMQKRALFEKYRQNRFFNNQDEVPDVHVKTPLQRAIQLLKRHRDIRFSNMNNESCKPISMIITVLAAQIYRNETTIYETLKNFTNTLSQHANQILPYFRFDETMARSTYTWITRTANGKWYIPNPTNTEENFADKWHEVENGIHHARAQAFFQWIAWVKEDFFDIANQLNEEHYFRALDISGYKDKSLSVFQPKPLMFNVTHRQKPESKWSVHICYKASISASYDRNGWRVFSDGSSKYEIFSGDPIARNKRICFKAKTNVPTPFQVFWQIVNTGEEAAIAGCLRGDFYSSDGECSFKPGKKKRSEPTKYLGDHWAECFIVKDGVCVARSGEFVVRIV